MTRARSDSASATGASARASDAMPCTSSTGGPDPRSTTFRGTPAPSTIGGMATIVPMEGFGGMFGDPDDEQHVLHRAADVERLEQEPEGREAEQPPHELDDPHLAEVAVAVAQDREPLPHPLPERAHLAREQREADEPAHGQEGQQEQRELQVPGEE